MLPLSLKDQAASKGSTSGPYGGPLVIIVGLGLAGFLVLPQPVSPCPASGLASFYPAATAAVVQSPPAADGG